MKKIIIILSAFTFITVNCRQVNDKQVINNEIAKQQGINIEQQSENIELQQDTVAIQKNLQDRNIFFSYWSSANIIFSISDDKKEGEVIIAGKKYIGTIEKNKYDEGVYNFYSNKKCIFMFQAEDNKIIIANQKYEIPGANEKAIELLLINQPNNMSLLYKEESNYIIDDIPLMNDKAYYLEQIRAYKEAIYILKKVISKKPDRAVAYLNIADVYWENNEKEKAKKSYKKYINLIKNQEKDTGKISLEVYDRVK